MRAASNLGRFNVGQREADLLRQVRHPRGLVLRHDMHVPGYGLHGWSPVLVGSTWQFAQHLPQGRHQAGDRHLKFHEDRDNLCWSTEGGFDGDVDRFFAGQSNGLVGAADAHGVYINLARRSGGSRVQIVVREGKPQAVEGGWEDVVEVSTTVPAGAETVWMTWAGEDSGPLDIEPGDYRVRVSAKGRDAG